MDKDMLTEFKPVVNYAPSFSLESDELKHFNIPHSQQLCEAAGLASQPLPPVTYIPLTLKGGVYNPVIQNKKLSTPQIEALIHAMQRFHSPYLNGRRLGYFIGDQTGVGKSRIIAALFKELFALGCQKGVWISSSMELRNAALTEMQEIFFNVRVLSLDDIEKNDSSNKPDKSVYEEGIVFVAYSMLRNKDKRRYKQLKSWLGDNFNGMIAFDECHNAKGVPDKDSKATYKVNKKPIKKSATRVVVEKLQKRYKEAAFLYVSATAGHQPTHWSYMSRLGLWGKGCIFKDAGEFVEKMKHRKMQGMELLTLELKKMGAFCCRQISLDGVLCKVIVCPLSDENKALYTQCTEIWQQIYEVVRIQQGPIILKRMHKIPLTEEEASLLTHSQFWAENQRFFEALIVCFKTEGLKNLITEYPADGQDKRYSIVVSLQSTGGSMLDSIQSVCYNDNRHPFSFCRSKLRYVLKKIGLTPVIDGHVLSQEVEAEFTTGNNDVKPFKSKITQIYRKIEYSLPMNAIDGFIEAFGGLENVAEITGRRKRCVKLDEKYVTVRITKSTEEERDLFQSGSKKVAIISQKGSTGINLHDSISCTNDSTRVQVCVQFPWQAESGMQQFGRTHRSHQRTNPIFILMVTDVPAEMRFYASFLERVKKLGAMCQGDRRASPLNFNLECEVSDAFEVASQACVETLLVLHEREDGQVLPSLESVGLYPEKIRKIDMFLNRMLCVPLTVQEKMMSTFRIHLNRLIIEAREKGSYDEGIKGFSPRWKLEFKSEKLLGPEDEPTTSSLITLKADRGLSWEALNKIIPTADVDPVFFTRKREVIVGFPVVRQGSFLGMVDNEIQIYRTYSPLNNVQQRTFAEDLKPDKYWKVEEDRDKVKDKWAKLFKRSSKEGTCEHVATRGICQLEKNCKEGMRVFTKTVIADNLLRTWDTIFNVYESRNIQMQTVQVCCRQGKQQLKFVGILVPEEAKDDIRQAVLRYYAACNEKTPDDDTPNEEVSSALSSDSEEMEATETENDDSDDNLESESNWHVVSKDDLKLCIKKSSVP